MQNNWQNIIGTHITRNPESLFPVLIEVQSICWVPHFSEPPFHTNFQVVGAFLSTWSSFLFSITIMGSSQNFDGCADIVLSALCLVSSLPPFLESNSHTSSAKWKCISMCEVTHHRCHTQVTSSHWVVNVWLSDTDVNLILYLIHLDISDF